MVHAVEVGSPTISALSQLQQYPHGCREEARQASIQATKEQAAASKQLTQALASSRDLELRRDRVLAEVEAAERKLADINTRASALSAEMRQQDQQRREAALELESFARQRAEAMAAAKRQDELREQAVRVSFAGAQ